jgi:hypothetical protein
MKTELTKELLEEGLKNKKTLGQIGEETGWGRSSVHRKSVYYGLKFPNKDGRQVIDISNREFGRLKVLHPVNKKTRRKYWMCECICGAKKEILGILLRSGNTKSCGKCCKLEKKLVEKYGVENSIPYTYFNKLVRNAVRRNLKFDISIEYANEILYKQNFKCKLSGLDILLNRKDCALKNSASIDRIDNKQGYTIGNIQWVHKDINCMKNIFDQNQFIEYCNLVSNHKYNNENLIFYPIIKNRQSNKQWKGYKAIGGAQWNQINQCALKRNNIIDFDIKFLWELYLEQKGRCALSNLPIEFSQSEKIRPSSSLDRIDSSQGYYKNNIQWVHKDINKIKSKFNQEYFINMCKLVAEYCKVIQ